MRDNYCWVRDGERVHIIDHVGSFSGYTWTLCGLGEDGPATITDPKVKWLCKNCLRIQAKRIGG